jgi:hypothetical protein
MTNSRVAEEVIERLLIARGLLDSIRYEPISERDRIALAKHILTAHDASELAIAAITQHLGQTPAQAQTYLMDYFPLLKKQHPEKEVKHRGYFSRLNEVRKNIKHKGLFPDPKDWKRVGGITWDYVSDWCSEYIGWSLDDLDQSSLIANPAVKKHFESARGALANGLFKDCLEQLGFACHALFKSNQALRNLVVGKARAEDAIKLAAFGVHANDYLALQEFLPVVGVNFLGENPMLLWTQEQYGHPGNWTEANARFCLNTFLQVALRIQDADWIPGALQFTLLYQYKITALVDNTHIIQPDPNAGLINMGATITIRTLNRGETLLCTTVKMDGPLAARITGREQQLEIYGFDNDLWGSVARSKVLVTCIPKDSPVIKKYFPDLIEIEYEP